MFFFPHPHLSLVFILLVLCSDLGQGICLQSFMFCVGLFVRVVSGSTGHVGCLPSPGTERWEFRTASRLVATAYLIKSLLVSASP